jgi:hypothetical protein
MKRLSFVIFFITFFCRCLFAQNINLTIPISYATGATTNRTVWITPQSVPTAGGGSVIIGSIIQTNSGTNGIIVLSNIAPNIIYAVNIKSPPDNQLFYCYPTNNVGTNINATNCLVANANSTFPAGTVAWAVASSDQRYAPIGTVFNGVLTFYTNVFTGTNTFTLPTIFQNSISLGGVSLSSWPTNLAYTVITNLNGLTNGSQVFAVVTNAGTNFSITSATGTHTFGVPTLGTAAFQSNNAFQSNSATLTYLALYPTNGIAYVVQLNALSNALGSAAFVSTNQFQSNSANLTSFAQLGTNAFVNQNLYNAFTNTLGSAAFVSTNQFQSNNANLTGWAQIPTNQGVFVTQINALSNSLGTAAFSNGAAFALKTNGFLTNAFLTTVTNSNVVVKGTWTAPTGASSAYVWTSDSSGNGSWQPSTGGSGGGIATLNGNGTNTGFTNAVFTNSVAQNSLIVSRSNLAGGFSGGLILTNPTASHFNPDTNQNSPAILLSGSGISQGLSSPNTLIIQNQQGAVSDNGVSAQLFVADSSQGVILVADPFNGIVVPGNGLLSGAAITIQNGALNYSFDSGNPNQVPYFDNFGNLQPSANTDMLPQGATNKWYSSSLVQTFGDIRYQRKGIKTVTTTYTVTTNDYDLICDTTSAGFTLTLPVASSTTNVFVFKNIGGNPLVISAAGSDLIDGLSLFTNNIKNQSDLFQSDGANPGNWRRIANHTPSNYLNTVYIRALNGGGTNTTLVNPNLVATNPATEIVALGSVANQNTLNISQVDTSSGYAASRYTWTHSANGGITEFGAVGISLTNSALYANSPFTPGSLYIESTGAPFGFVSQGNALGYFDTSAHQFHITDSTGQADIAYFNRLNGGIGFPSGVTTLSNGVVNNTLNVTGLQTNFTNLIVGGQLTVTNSSSFSSNRAGITTTGHFTSWPSSNVNLTAQLLNGNFVAGSVANWLDSIVSVDDAVIGGFSNTMSGKTINDGIIAGFSNSFIGTLGNGFSNSVIVGGINNTISNTTLGFPGPEGSVIIGGGSNLVSKQNAIAAGVNTIATNEETFIWSSSPTPFNTTSNGQFLVNATNGVGINTNNPGTNALSVFGGVNITGNLSANSSSAKELLYPSISQYPLVWTNLGGQPDSMLIPIPAAHQGDAGDLSIPVIIPDPFASTCGGFFFPMFTTNAKAGNIPWGILSSGQTNYLKDLKAFQIGAVGEQSVDIGAGTVGIFNDPGYAFQIGGFNSGKENDWLYQDPTNWLVRFPQGNTSAGIDPRNAQDTMVIDENNNFVIITNALKVGTNILFNYGNGSVTGVGGNGTGQNLFTNAGGIGRYWIDGRYISPFSTVTITNLQIQPSPGAVGTLGNILGMGFMFGAISNYNLIFGDGFTLAPGLQISSVGNATKGTTAVLLYNPYMLGWTTDGGGNIGLANDARPGNIYVKTSLVDSGQLIVTNSDNTQQTPVDIEGSTNGFYQVFVRNTNNGASASSDFIVANDRGSQVAESNYVDLGINSSTFTPGGGLNGGPNDAYLYCATNSTNLLIGTRQTNGTVQMIIGASNVMAFSTNGIVIGPLTNKPSFTLINTNWIDGATYTNQTGRPIQVWAPCSMTPASIVGVSGYSLAVPGSTTNSFSQATLIGTLVMPVTNKVGPLWVTNSGTFTFTNISTGAGNYSAILNGGQYMVY